MTMTNKHVCIIGGGLAGLTAALHLNERGITTTLLEREVRCGGRVAGGKTVSLMHHEQQWSFTAEHGIHGLWGQYHNMRAMLQRYGIQPAFVAARHDDWIHNNHGTVKIAETGSTVRRSILPAPFHYIALLVRPDFLRMLSWRDFIGLMQVAGTMYLAFAYDPLMEPAPLEGRTMEGQLDLWPPGLRALFTALLRSGLAAHPEDIALSGFLAFLRFYTMLRRDSWEFDYFPADADTCLIKPLTHTLTNGHGTIHTLATATRLEQLPNGTGWRVYWQHGQHDATTAEQTIEVSHVVLALDAPAAHALLTHSPDTAHEVNSLVWPQGLATAIVRLWFTQTPHKGAEAGICSGDFTVDNFFWLHRFQDTPAEWHRATSGSVVEAHIYGPQELLDEPDPILLARAINDFTRTYPELRGTLLHSTLQRNPATHTRFNIGASPRYLGVESPWHNITCCGDWLRYPHPALFLERSCTTGIAAANRILQSYEEEPFPVLPVKPPELPAAWIERALRGFRNMVRRFKATPPDDTTSTTHTQHIT